MHRSFALTGTHRAGRGTCDCRRERGDTLNRVGECWTLFQAFFKIGLFTFGGGYSMISMIESEIAERRGWLGSDELMEVFAIAESTPGPIAVNCATYVGYRRAGVWGSACATLGVVLPSFIIIYLISLCVERFMAFKAVRSAFRGIQVAVAFLVLRAGLRLTRRLPKGAFEWTACAVAGAAALGVGLLNWKLSTIWLIVAGAAAGLWLFGRRRT